MSPNLKVCILWSLDSASRSSKRGRSKLTEGLRDLVLVLWRRVMTSKSTVVILCSLSTTSKLLMDLELEAENER